MMDDLLKLRMLLPHWIEHNQEHAAEFVRWAELATASGHGEATELIRAAAREMQQVNHSLQTALDKLGGPAPMETHGHEH